METQTNTFSEIDAQFPAKNTSDRDNLAPEMSAIPEVSLPATLTISGKSAAQFEDEIQEWVDKYQIENQHEDLSYPTSSPSLKEFESGPRPLSTQIVSALTNQVYLDNNEQLYILVTDVDAYVLNSRPNIWLDSDSEKNDDEDPNDPDDFQGMEEKLDMIHLENDESRIAFNCLFHIDSEIFVLFLFSPMEIAFVLDVDMSPNKTQGNGGKVTNIFFHGNSSAYVTSSGSHNNGADDNDERLTKTITIQFLEM